jgi:chromosome partitioning protein
MIQEYGQQPISTQRPFIAQTKRLSGVKVMDPYIKRNDTIFGDAPQYGVPTVLIGYGAGSHTSVVQGLEEVADAFCAGIDL